MEEAGEGARDSWFGLKAAWLQRNEKKALTPTMNMGSSSSAEYATLHLPLGREREKTNTAEEVVKEGILSHAHQTSRRRSTQPTPAAYNTECAVKLTTVVVNYSAVGARDVTIVFPTQDAKRRKLH